MGIEVNTDMFESEVIESEIPVLVDFWGPRCRPCLNLKPEVESLSEMHHGKFKLVEIDASKNRRLCMNLKVLGLPTFLIYKDGKEVDRLSGGELKIGEIEAAISKVINS